MAKIQIKSEKLTPFGGIFSIVLHIYTDNHAYANQFQTDFG